MSTKQWRRIIGRHHLIITYVVFSLLIGMGFLHMQTLQDQLERESILRSHTLCLSQNDLKEDLQVLLVGLAAPRDEDDPGDFEERESVRERLEPLFNPVNCPPPPP